MNWMPRCAVCVANRNAAAAAAPAEGDETAAELPDVRHAVTLAGGTALCGPHVIPVTPQPGQAARAAGLLF